MRGAGGWDRSRRSLEHGGGRKQRRKDQRGSRRTRLNGNTPCKQGKALRYKMRELNTIPDEDREGEASLCRDISRRERKAG